MEQAVEGVWKQRKRLTLTALLQNNLTYCLPVVVLEKGGESDNWISLFA